jgi:hypothetical protein
MSGWEIANQECDGVAWVDIMAPEPVNYDAVTEKIQAVLQAS